MTGPERLHRLLPAVLRARDHESGEPLRALLTVLDGELEALRTATEALWDDWFVETCAEDRLPLLAEALGLPVLDAGADQDADRPAHRGTRAGPSQRAWVANAVRRRRRQGTNATLGELAADVTRYPAHAVEMATRTATTARLDRRRPVTAPAVADLRSPADVATLGGASDPFAHLADLRRVDGGVARWRPGVVGLFLRRTRPQEVIRAGARPVPGVAGAYRVDPLGAAVPLLPGPTGTGPGSGPAVRVRLAAAPDRDLVPRTRRLPPDDDPALPRPDDGEVLVDVGSGRLVLAAEQAPDAADPVEVLVDYVHGAPGPLGAGPGDRTASWAAQLGGAHVDRVFRVDRDGPPPDAADGPVTFADLEGAARAWTAWVLSLPVPARRAAVGVIAITDSRRHACPAVPLSAPDGSRLHLVAGGRRPPPGTALRAEDVLPARARPCLVGDLRVAGTRAVHGEHPGGVVLNGIVVDGAVVVEPGDLARLDLAHTTVAGGVRVGVATGGLNTALEIALTSCVSGQIATRTEAGVDPGRSTVAGVRARGSVLAAPEPRAAVGEADAGSPAFAVDLRGAVVRLDRCTLLGGLRCRTLEADDSLLDPDGGDPTRVVDVEVRQEGAVRFCYVPETAPVPRRYACQPDRAIAAAPRDRAATSARLRPVYVSRTLGTPGYLALADTCAPELLAAAADGGEPGVWHDLGHTHRMAALAAAIPPSLRPGLQAGAIVQW